MTTLFLLLLFLRCSDVVGAVRSMSCRQWEIAKQQLFPRDAGKFGQDNSNCPVGDRTGRIICEAAAATSSAKFCSVV